jgi:hypothetical protein
VRTTASTAFVVFTRWRSEQILVRVPLAELAQALL